MSISTSRLSYGDCYEAMEKALDDSAGVRIKVESHDMAHHLRLRMHTARSIDRKDNKTLHEEGAPLYGRSIYDRLVLKIRQINGETWLYIEQLVIKGELQLLSEVPADEPAEAPAEAPAPITGLRRI